MPPTADDFEVFTGITVDDRVEALLSAALAQARRYCGWHVTPTAEQTFTLWGSGTQILMLPTLNLTAVTTVDEDGEAVDLETLTWTAKGWLVKPLSYLWPVTKTVTVEAEHGFDVCPDFDAAVYSMVQRAVEGVTAQVTAGPFTQYPTELDAGLSLDEKAKLDLYRLERAP